MRAIIQRVSSASVTISEKKVAEMEQGLLILLGIEPADTESDIEWLSNKISNLRVFNDENDIMNNSLLSISGDAIVVSQFTLHANTKKGNRPSYIKAAKPDIAIPMYEQFVKVLSEKIRREVGTGEFGADMKVALVNDGPVTIILDSKQKDI